MEQLYTFTIFTENRVGLLNQISIIFTRRSVNIESLSVSPSSIPAVHKFIITANCDADMAEKIVRQVEKRIDVIKAFYYTDDELIYQEVALYKVPTNKLIEEKDLEQIIRNYNAIILEIDKDFTVIEKTGHSEETKGLFYELKKYGILQFVRSGRVAVTKYNEELLSLYLAEREECRKQLENGDRQ